MIKRFEEVGKLGVQPTSGRKSEPPVLVDGVKTVVEAQSETSGFGEQVLDRQVVLTAPSKKFSENNALLPIHDPPNSRAA
ncbi:hypothetical protein TNCT_735831 [Trichonephila clavata]|uniref:Uncharacterized protein n=1 Tax=Trichonephila clavata TaxID=2740835 RepID=A0A8X6I513_TRICU|nr:hypothetical protein TNCT_735831 [Trichonephila clavata]